MKKFEIVWDIEDIKTEAEEIGITLSDDKAEEILDWVAHTYDAMNGVCWATIRESIHYILDETKEY